MTLIAYRPKLDTLRAIAILLVLLSHWLGDCNLIKIPIVKKSGVLGVNLFFVISGYLITNNLMVLYAKYPFGEALKTFFMKRVLRLFPALYMFLAIVFLVQFLTGFWVVNKYSDLLWYLFYVPNFFILEHGWIYPSINNLWSLAVEEQFYLLWPFVIYIFRKQLIPVLIIIIVAGLFFITLFDNINTAKLFPMGNFNYLAGGALLAVYSGRINIIKSMAIVAAALVAIYFTPSKIAVDCLTALIFVLITGIFCSELPPFFEKIFNIGLVKYIGKISYGIYLYHRFIVFFLYGMNIKFNWGISDIAIFCLLFPITFYVAHLSYKYYESYFLKIKDKKFA